MTFRQIAVTAALALTAACKSSSSTNEPVPPGDGGLTLLVKQSPELPGATCPYGGTLVSAGLDTDRDGILDPAEIAKVEPVCDPAPGTVPEVLTRTATEPAGVHCAEGGTRIDAGRDVDGDGVLADGEVEGTAYACIVPAPVTPPDPVPPPPPVLTRVDFEPIGANCVGGGSAVRYGPDTDGSGTLGDAEVTGVQYVCETRVLPGFTIRTKADADLVSAATIVDGYLYVELAEAIDLDLSPTAVTGGISVRSPALTGLGLYCWMIGDSVVVEGNAKLQRFWMGSVQALGGDVIVRDNPELTSLLVPSGKGLSGLETFRYPGDLVVARNAKLPYLGLSHPAEVGGDLVIEGNPALAYLFLDGLTRVGGDFVLADDDALEELPSVEPFAIETVGGELDIRDNAKLTLFRFDALQATGGLRLERNASLLIARFPKLVAVLGHVAIRDNPVLNFSWNLPGPLQTVTGWFTIERNAMLGSLVEFNNVTEIGGGLQVRSNPKLRALGFDRLARAESVTVSDNATLEVIGTTPATDSAALFPPSLTRLETVQELYVTNNLVLRQLILPSLRGVSSWLTVADNPLLPTCQAQALPGSYKTISGNDDTATCP